MQRFETVAGDTGKPIEGILSDADGPVSLLGATVRFWWMPNPASGISDAPRTGLATVVAPLAAIGDVDRGRVRYHFAEGQLVPGLFIGQFRAVWQDGSAVTFPSPDADDEGDSPEAYIDMIVGRSLAV